MYCANCRSDVDVMNGYCSKCGVAVSARLCPKGHVMDPSWSECRLCSPSSIPAAGSKGRTLAENPAAVAPPPGGFVKGATLLEDLPLRGSVKGATIADLPGPAARPAKSRTVFDPGLAAGVTPQKTAAVPMPKLVGWLVSFSHDPSGEDFRLREGRNLIGSSGDCDIVIDHPSVSAKHAVIMFREGKFQLRDNDSTNGTYVNGEDVFGKGAVVIENGSRLRIGDSECVLYAIAQ